MDPWTVISNTSSLVQLLGAGIAASQFILQRVNLTADERARAVRICEGNQLALDLIASCQGDQPVSPQLLLRVERHRANATSYHRSNATSHQRPIWWSRGPQNEMLENMELQQLLIIGALVTQLRTG